MDDNVFIFLGTTFRQIFFYRFHSTWKSTLKDLFEGLQTLAAYGTTEERSAPFNGNGKTTRAS